MQAYGVWPVIGGQLGFSQLAPDVNGPPPRCGPEIAESLCQTYKRLLIPIEGMFPPGVWERPQQLAATVSPAHHLAGVDRPRGGPGGLRDSNTSHEYLLAQITNTGSTAHGQHDVPQLPNNDLQSKHPFSDDLAAVLERWSNVWFALEPSANSKETSNRPPGSDRAVWPNHHLYPDTDVALLLAISRNPSQRPHILSRAADPQAAIRFADILQQVRYLLVTCNRFGISI